MEQTSAINLQQCPICQNTLFKPYLETKDYFLTQEPFNIDQCKTCSLIFTNPVPTKKELPKYYDSPDYLSHTASGKSITGLVYKALRDRNIRYKYNIIRQYKDKGSILDIGSGTGELLSYFKQKGWETTGIEPNKNAREYAIESHKIDVFDESKLDQLQENSFDIISLWHVLEHVYDLDERMKQIKRLGKKDSYVIIAVPNIDSPDAKKYKEKWAALDIPRHLYHFSRNSISALLSRNNMELIKMYPMRLDAFYVSLLSEKYLGKKIPAVPAFFSGIQSNIEARKENNYSSMIFVAKQN